jgi:DNA-binding transcriptional ArsR family regulator
VELASGLFFVRENFSLDIFPYRNVSLFVPRAATTSDAFNAVAEPRRREILNYLALQERPVGEIVAALGLEQPSVSKHLRVLRDVGLVRVRREGRNMLYSLDAEAIRPLYEWTRTFERFWRHQLQRVKERAEKKQAEKEQAEKER